MAGLAGKEGPTPSEGLLGLWFFAFLPSITPAPPWSIKGRAGPATKGIDSGGISSTHTTLHTQLSYDQALGDLFDHSIRDLGLVPLSTVCTPYYELFLVLITQAAAAN